MNNKKLEKFLNEYLPAMDETIPTCINLGGCGFFAVELAKVLNTMGVKFDLYALYDDNDDPTTIKHLVSGDINFNQVTVGHAAIKLEGCDRFIDATGEIPQCYMDVYVNRIKTTVDQLDDVTQKGKRWNNTFDKTQEPKIKKYLSEIPKLLPAWEEGTYDHSFDDEREKGNLNSHTIRQLNSEYINLRLSRIFNRQLN